MSVIDAALQTAVTEKTGISLYLQQVSDALIQANNASYCTLQNDTYLPSSSLI